MTSKALKKPLKEANETCIHHWIIDPPEGTVSSGYCIKCGEKKDFVNHYSYSTWESTSTLLKDLGVDINLSYEKNWSRF